MGNSLNKIWLHVVFTTKNRNPLIHFDIENDIYIHMHEQLIKSGCYVHIINGMPDHVHLLFWQNHKMSIIDIIKQVKGNTSHWINEQKLIPYKFVWQRGFAAFSVSESHLERIFQYIKNQKRHHRDKTMQLTD